MRVIFAGTPAFASQALAAIVAAGHEVVLVLTRADKPAGRGQKLLPSPVKLLAQTHGLAVFQPTSLRDEAAQAVLAQAGADVMVVAAYGMILPPAVLALPRLGCLNIHGSLLPRWRGAAPIQRAIEAGDAETGITIMQMDAGLDTGPMLLARAIPIGREESSAGLHDRLAELGAELIVQALADLPAGRLRAQVQPQEGVTYAHKILKAEAAIDWRADARHVVDRIRAFDPFPGCVGWLRPAGQAGDRPAEAVKIWQARQVPADGPAAGSDEASPGTITAVGPEGLRVACGRGSVDLLSLQRPGGRRLPVAQWLQSGAPAAGSCFEPPPAEPSARVS